MTWSIIDDINERNFKNYDLTKLAIDEFYLSVDGLLDHEYNLYTLHRECFQASKKSKYSSIIIFTYLFLKHLICKSSILTT